MLSDKNVEFTNFFYVKINLAATHDLLMKFKIKHKEWLVSEQ